MKVTSNFEKVNHLRVLRTSKHIIDQQKKAYKKAQELSDNNLIKGDTATSPTKSIGDFKVSVSTGLNDISNVTNSPSVTCTIAHSDTVTPSPVISGSIQSTFDHIQDRDLFGSREFCSACKHIYGKFGIQCAELQYRDFCLQSVVDYIDEKGGLSKIDEIGISLRYWDAYNVAVKKDILTVSGCYEINNVNPMPKCMNEGSYAQALDILQNLKFVETLYNKRKHNLWGWLDAGNDEDDVQVAFFSFDDRWKIGLCFWISGVGNNI